MTITEVWIDQIFHVKMLLYLKTKQNIKKVQLIEMKVTNVTVCRCVWRCRSIALGQIASHLTAGMHTLLSAANNKTKACCWKCGRSSSAGSGSQCVTWLTSSSRRNDLQTDRETENVQITNLLLKNVINDVTHRGYTNTSYSFKLLLDYIKTVHVIGDGIQTWIDHYLNLHLYSSVF